MRVCTACHALFSHNRWSWEQKACGVSNLDETVSYRCILVPIYSLQVTAWFTHDMRLVTSFDTFCLTERVRSCHTIEATLSACLICKAIVDRGYCGVWLLITEDNLAVRFLYSPIHSLGTHFSTQTLFTFAIFGTVLVWCAWLAH